MKKKVLVIQQEIVLRGGGAIAQKCVIDGLRSLGHEVFTLSFCGNHPEDFPEHHFSIPRQYGRGNYRKYWYDRSLVSSIREIIGRVEPDIVFIGNIWNFLSVINATRVFKIPVLHAIHTAEYFCPNAMLTQRDTMKACEGGVGLKCR